MRTDTRGKHHVKHFESLDEYVDWIASIEDRAKDMSCDTEFYGCASTQEGIDKARAGLPREGIEALGIAGDALREMDRDLVTTRFQFEFQQEGDWVDVGRYLSGEPECMVMPYQEDYTRTDRIVTIVVALGVHCGITDAAIKSHGEQLVALLEAIDSTGLQVEFWADLTVKSEYDLNNEGTAATAGHTSTQAIKIKGAGESFDAASFMFALTHNAFWRALGFNGLRHSPKAWTDAFGYHLGYPHNGRVFLHPEDYPEGAIYVPALKENGDAGKYVPEVLRRLGLLKD